MRANVVFVSLLLLLTGLAGGLVLGQRSPRVVSKPGSPDEAASPQGGPPSTSSAPIAGEPGAASASASTAASAVPTVPAAPPRPRPSLARPLRVVGVSWEALAPGVGANRGVEPKPEGLYGEAGLEVALRALDDPLQVENALARGGEDPKGADVVILSLAQLAAAQERLALLDPVVFFVAGWSEGGEVLRGPETGLEDLDAGEPVALHGQAGEGATLLALFVFQAMGQPVQLVDDPSSPWRALREPPSEAGLAPLRGRRAVTTAEASRLLPQVAVARTRFLEAHEPALHAWVEGWLAGHDHIDEDAAAVAGWLARAEGTPDLLPLLNDMSAIGPASLLDNARALGLAGRGKVTLAALYERSRALWRSVDLVEGAPPRLRVDATVVASLIRRGGLDRAEDDGEAGGRAVEISAEDDREEEAASSPLLVYREDAASLDEDAFLERIGWLAGVFPAARLAIRLPFANDEAAVLAARARRRFGLAEDRVTVDDATDPTMATLSVERAR